MSLVEEARRRVQRIFPILRTGTIPKVWKLEISPEVKHPQEVPPEFQVRYKRPRLR